MDPWCAYSPIMSLWRIQTRFRSSIATAGVGSKGSTVLQLHSTLTDYMPFLNPYYKLLTQTRLDSDYYDAFVSIQRGLFNTRDRAEHSRKRKTISHTFSTKSIGQFEQYMARNLQELVKQWDRISDTATSSGQQYADMDCLHWFNYIAFDVIGDLVSVTQLRLHDCILKY